MSSQREEEHIVGHLMALSQRCKQEALPTVSIASMSTNESAFINQFVLELDETKKSSH